MELLEQIQKHKIVPVVVLSKLEDAEPTLKALCDGGLPVAEITFRTECAADAIRLGCEKFPEMLIGAGTVIRADQAIHAIDCGAKFIVGPGFSAEVADVCNRLGVLYLPGCVTPTEIIAAMAAGVEIVKFFPGSNFGGLGAIKALSAAFLLFFIAAPIYRICGHGILSSAPSLFKVQRVAARGKSDRR